MKIRVQRLDGLWELLDLPSEKVGVLDLEGESNCVFAGAVNHYFDQDGFYLCTGRSLESMTNCSAEEAETQVAQMELGRRFQDALDAEVVGEIEQNDRT